MSAVMEIEAASTVAIDAAEKQRERHRRWCRKNRAHVAAYARMWRKKNPERAAAIDRKRAARKIQQALSREGSVLAAKLARLLRACKARKKFPCSITRHDLRELWDRQAGRCAVSGREMVLHNGDYVVSIDRIDSARSYEKDNVRLVCWWVNRARSAGTDTSLLDWCSAIMANQYPGAPYDRFYLVRGN